MIAGRDLGTTYSPSYLRLGMKQAIQPLPDGRGSVTISSEPRPSGRGAEASERVAAS